MRFAFGKNWISFLERLDEGRVQAAAESLAAALGRRDLRGASFLDAGSGSGLTSLAARRLGARVLSFDLDPDSVACARTLRERFAAADPSWRIEQGSVLDERYLEALGTFDIVCSWGVLHHTGDLARALELITLPVAEGGLLFLALYNDQGARSRAWRAVKRLYCRGPLGRALILASFAPAIAAASVVVGLARHGTPWGYFTHYRARRGMSVWHDWLDWLGGYPFEVALPDEVDRFYASRGFAPLWRKTTRGWGCNEFVYRRAEEPSGPRTEQRQDLACQEQRAGDHHQPPRPGLPPR